MIKRIDRCDRDIFTCEQLKVADYQEETQPEDYSNRVVIKPWGYEYLIFENEFVAVWFLRINKGHGTSMHCHPRKRTSLVVLEGDAVCSTFGQRHEISGLGAIILEKGVFHSTKSVSGIELIEVESPPNKTDLVRLGDAYGRERSGYEGLSEMRTTNLGEYGFFSFFDPAYRQLRRNGYQVQLETYQPEQLNSEFRADSNAYYCSCGGQLFQGNELLLDVGATISGADLLGISLSAQQEVLLLKFATYT